MGRIISVFLLSLLAPSIARAETFTYLRLTRVVDGDTLVGDVVIHAPHVTDSLPWGIEVNHRPAKVTLRNQRIRLLDVDAWELKDKGGSEAKEAVEKVLTDEGRGNRLRIDTAKQRKDSFGRLLVRISIPMREGNVDLSNWIIENKHGRRWAK